MSQGEKPQSITLADFEDDPRVVDEEEFARIDSLLRECPPACARWLKEYIVLGSKMAASRAMNYTNSMFYVWRRDYPDFAALLTFYDGEIRERWNEVAERLALEGFREEIYRPDGTLKGKPN